MAENTKIEWAKHTFNPWLGCTKVSPACDHCYAEDWANRFRPRDGLWSGNRAKTSASTWAQPRRWNAEAAKANIPASVFCASMADVFDNQVPRAWRADLFGLIRETPFLIWMLLSKRPQNMPKFLPDDWGDGWCNVWLGTTVENQAEADRRVPALIRTPAARRFLSCEPLLELVEFFRASEYGDEWHDYLSGHWGAVDQDAVSTRLDRGQTPGIDLLICGGESGHNARPLNQAWVRSLREHCRRADTVFFFKQWGEWAPQNQLPPDTVIKDTEKMKCFWVNQPPMVRVGKARAGAYLDGETHQTVPA